MIPNTPHAERSQLELLYHISRELSSRLELRELIERILRLTSESVGAENSSLILISEVGQVYDAALIVNGALVSDAASQLGPQLERGLAGWALRQKQSVLVPNTASDTRWQPAGKGQPAESKSALATPLIYADRVLGVITLVHPVPNRFNERDQALVKTIAEQAAIAVENARLLRESRRQTQAMRSLVETAQVLSSTLDPNKLLQLLLEQALRHLHLEAASIALMDANRQDLVFQMAVGVSAEKMLGLRLKLGQGIAGWVAQNRQPVIVPDVENDPRFYPEMDHLTGFRTRSVLCAPIQFEGYLLGIIECLNPAPGTLDRNTLPLLSGISSLAGNAIAHAQQFSFTEAVKDRFAGLFEDGIDPIFITDLTGKIIDANHKAAVALGYSRGELVGMSMKQVHRVTTGLLGSSPMPDLVSGIERAFVTRLTTKDNLDIPVEVHAKRIKTPDMEFIQWIERDVSERVQMEEMREDLTAMIFHDLRSPLGNVISSLTMLQQSLPSNDEMSQSLVGIAIRSGQHLSRLVDSLLDLKRLEGGKAVLHKEDALLANLVNEALQQVQPTAQGKGIDLRNELPAWLPVVRVDADMIRRVIINLIENAVKYTPGSGSVTVSVKADTNEALISILDTGPGIPESERTRIFDKFARIQRIGAPKGLGLGLAFCRLAVEAHGGRIWVEPAPKQGAVFNFTLPVKR
ncbi:MAG TPA: GAF domain-containing protein [Anaerolineales bacterium]|nr:GAF domain-containing protein [Anaerolineales bacterium]